jgi:hypothetical protein
MTGKMSPKLIEWLVNDDDQPLDDMSPPKLKENAPEDVKKELEEWIKRGSEYAMTGKIIK